jgi:hypothetical protein
MGAGMSKEAQYRIVYRELHKIQRELAEKGVVARYKNRALFGQKGSDVFCVGFHRSNASNGECFLHPTAEINIDGKWANFNGCEWMPEPSFRKNALPLILDHFAPARVDRKTGKAFSS